MSTSIENYKERQDNEMLSITAIFPDEVKDLRRVNKWTTWSPLEMEIKVFPEESVSGNKCITQVDLYVKCSDFYPEVPPYIDIKNFKGISSEDLGKLKNELQGKIQQYTGQEMILELVYHTRSFLYHHRKPYFDSFYDEMVSNKLRKQKEEAERLEKQKKELESVENQKMQAIEQERQRKIEALRDANKRNKPVDVASNKNSPSNSTKLANESVHRSRSRSLCKENCSDKLIQNECKEILNMKLKFNGKREFSIICGHCLNHNERGCVVYNGLDITTGHSVVVIKWTFLFNFNHKLKGEELESYQREQSNYTKQINLIEQEFKSLKQINNRHLVHYLGMNYIAKKDKIIVYVLQDYVSGCSIEHIYSNIHLTVPQLQHYSLEILEALKYLHENCVVHKNLRISSLFIDNNGSIRVSDYSLDKRLYDLHRTWTKEEEIDLYPPTIGKGGKKSDIYRFGILLLTLVTGPLSKENPVRVPENLNPTFRDFVIKCLLHNEQDRWTAAQLLSHPFLALPPGHSILPKEADLKDDEKDVDLPFLCDEVNHGSRLQNEFDILKILGKGGFGHVWKVKNKLDSRVYALKRIALNPSNRQLNRKIKREVKLLSRLNHENIVRYFNSWIEATPDASNAIQNREEKPSGSENEQNEKTKKESSVQWEIHNKPESSSEDEDECDDDLSIIFMQDSENKQEAEQQQDEPVNTGRTSSTNLATSDTNSKHKKGQSVIRQFMYIQMEFCEKSTLRTAIDNGLHKDVSLVWRLFREIVEGLHYIHQQGVIHRDLKPVNIFLDSNDHVKIGDFGLATDVISKPFAINDMLPSDFASQSRSDILEDGTQTGNVGTALYSAPELASIAIKASYSQKVDIYSLGIIFFEMCYPPPVTAMERLKIISCLRQKDVNLHTEIHEILTDEMIQIIKWLLQHDVSKRPSSNELITSKYIPPLLMEETELNTLLHTTVSNPQSRMYKRMINALFDQEVATEFDFTYDLDVFRSQSLRSKPTQVFSNVVETLVKIMRLYGAVLFSVPTLMPKSSIIDSKNYVHIMEHGGGIVMLPHNLRVPFARHIARKETDFLKRYALEKVFREQKIFGCHPREQYEFAFDIVTPTPNSFLPDAEVITAVSDIVAEFQSLESKNYYIRLNHVSLLKAILIFCDIDDKLEVKIYEVAGEQRNKTITKAMLLEEEHNFELSQRTLSRIAQFIEMEETFEKMNTLLYPVTQRKGQACILAKKSLRELENIVALTQSLGIKLPIVICPGLVHNISLFSGMIFQCACKLKSTKRKDALDILAAGGRYDKLISSFKLKAFSETGKPINQSAVGVSIAVENIVSAELEAPKWGIADFLIHSEDTGLSSEKASLLKELRELGLSATVMYDKTMTLDDTVDFCRNQGISQILVLRKEDPGIIKIRTVERDKVTEKRVIYSEIKEHLPKMCSKGFTENHNRVEYTRSSSFSNSNILMNVHFLTQDKTHNNRKREQNIRTHVISTLHPSSSRPWELIPVDLKMLVIGTIVSHCDICSTIDGVQRSFDLIIDEYSKYKKYLSQLCEEICDIKYKKSNCAIVLYSLPDNNFRVLF